MWKRHFFHSLPVPSSSDCSWISMKAELLNVNMEEQTTICRCIKTSNCHCKELTQIKARPTRCNKWWFIGSHLFLNVFRASLSPSSGEQTACHCLWFPFLALVVVVPESVQCAEDVACQATSSAHCTHLATWLSGTTTTIARTGNHRQWHAVCSPDDGLKDARNTLRNKWLPINHHLLHLVGLAFIRLSKMHGQSSIKVDSVQSIHSHPYSKLVIIHRTVSLTNDNAKHNYTSQNFSSL